MALSKNVTALRKATAAPPKLTDVNMQGAADNALGNAKIVLDGQANGSKQGWMEPFRTP